MPKWHLLAACVLFVGFVDIALSQHGDSIFTCVDNEECVQASAAGVLANLSSLGLTQEALATTEGMAIAFEDMLARNCCYSRPKPKVFRMRMVDGRNLCFA
jgi:hypothetical protein